MTFEEWWQDNRRDVVLESQFKAARAAWQAAQQEPVALLRQFVAVGYCTCPMGHYCDVHHKPDCPLEEARDFLEEYDG